MGGSREGRQAPSSSTPPPHTESLIPTAPLPHPRQSEILALTLFERSLCDALGEGMRDEDGAEIIVLAGPFFFPRLIIIRLTRFRPGVDDSLPVRPLPSVQAKKGRSHSPVPYLWSIMVAAYYATCRERRGVWQVNGHHPSSTSAEGVRIHAYIWGGDGKVKSERVESKERERKRKEGKGEKRGEKLEGEKRKELP